MKDSQLAHDRLGDVLHAAEAVEARRDALEHLQVRDRADVASRVEGIRSLADVPRVHDDAVLPSGLGGHHRRLGAVDQVAGG